MDHREYIEWVQEYLAWTEELAKQADEAQDEE